MSWARAVAVFFLWTILPGTGWGADMKLGVSGAVEYDDNIFRNDFNKKEDAVFRITPRVVFVEDEGKLHWDVRYAAPWEKAINTDKVDGFNHLLGAEAEYHINGRTRTFLTDRFRYSDSINRFSTISEGGAAPALGTFRQPVIRNELTLGVQHSFTPRLAGNLAFTHRLFETDIPSRSDNMVYVGNTNLQYMLDSQHKVGGGAALTYQDFEASKDGGTPPSQTLFFNMYAIWTWVLDETTQFSITGGPTYVDTQYDPPPVFIEGAPLVPFIRTSDGILVNNLTLCPADGPGGEQVIPETGTCGIQRLLRDDDAYPLEQDDIQTIENNASAATLASLGNGGGGSSTWTFFGEVSLQKRWTPRLVSSLTYRRTDSTASGTGSATLDLVSFITTWSVSELWTFQVRGDFTHRESVTASQENLTVVDGGTTQGTTITLTSDPTFPLAHAAAFATRISRRPIDTDRWGVGIRMERRLTKHIRASLRYRYNQQSSGFRTVGRSSDFSNNLVTLGVHYDFDRWHLW
jgi:hypothetical protein